MLDTIWNWDKWPYVIMGAAIFLVVLMIMMLIRRLGSVVVIGRPVYIEDAIRAAKTPEELIAFFRKFPIGNFTDEEFSAIAFKARELDFTSAHWQEVSEINLDPDLKSFAAAQAAKK